MNVALQKVLVWDPWQESPQFRRSAGRDGESLAMVSGGRVRGVLGREGAFSCVLLSSPAADAVNEADGGAYGSQRGHLSCGSWAINNSSSGRVSATLQSSDAHDAGHCRTGLCEQQRPVTSKQILPSSIDP